MTDDEQKAIAGLANALNDAAEALKEAGATLGRAPQYLPAIGSTGHYLSQIRTMISSIENLAREFKK
jgi:hypothetical protein